MFGLGMTELAIVVVATALVTVVPIAAICWLVVVLVRSSEAWRPPRVDARDGGDRPDG